MKRLCLISILGAFCFSTLSSQTYRSYLDSALVMSEKGNLPSAIALCVDAIKLDSTSTQAYFYKAGFHVAMISGRNASVDYTNYKAAVADYTKVLELDQNNFESLFFRGGAHSNMGFLELAIKDYKASILLNSRQPEVYNSLAVCYARTGYPKEALVQINMAIDQDRNYAKAYSNRGNIYDMMRNNLKACENWKQAIELGYQGGVRQYNAKCK